MGYLHGNTILCDACCSAGRSNIVLWRGAFTGAGSLQYNRVSRVGRPAWVQDHYHTPFFRGGQAIMRFISSKRSPACSHGITDAPHP